MEKQNIKKRTYDFAVLIIKFGKKLEKTTTSQILLKQIIRSGTSVGANVMEAQAGSSKKDFINFLYYALKSANETVFWLEIIKETENVDIKEVERIHGECVEISKILGSSLVTLKK